MISQKSRIRRFQRTRTRLQKYIDEARQTEARFIARSLLEQLTVIAQEHPEVTVRELLTKREDTFD